MGTPDELKASVGGDVMMVKTEHPADLMLKIKQRLNVDASLVDHEIRIEKTGVHALLPGLMENFGAQVRSVTVGKPTLLDVFFRVTGRRFEGDR
jgi:ABC-2 type transport system ATP-binding protein